MARRAFCGLWTIIIDYEHNLSHNVFLTYPQILRFCQILPNFALFWQNLRDLSVTHGRTDEDERTDAHTLQIWGSPTQKALRAIISLKGIPRFHFFSDDEIWDLLVSSLQTCWKTFFWCLLTLRVNRNSISDGFGAISRQNHNGEWWISGENPLFWSILVSWNYSSPPPPRKKSTPWSRKIFFHEKSLGNDIPCKLSKSEVLRLSERWDTSILRILFFSGKKKV